MGKILRYVALPAAIVVFACKMWAFNADSLISQPDEIVNRYVAAVEADGRALHGSMDVEINAAVPQLKEHGLLRASRRISSVGRISYRVLGFEGDTTIKNQVIARYLNAEQEAREKQDLSITPANYKFKFKGTRALPGDQVVYVFEVTPRAKRVGLFKGEMWLDSASFLPIYERGRLVKSPSLFFKRVQFQRIYQIRNGLAVPEYMASSIETRIVGRVELAIQYSNFAPEDPSGAGTETESGPRASLP